MNLTDVMQQVAARLQTLPGLVQVNDHPVDAVSVPAAMVAWPELVTYDGTYQRGMDSFPLPVLLIVGRVSDTAARDQLARYVDGSGAASVKQVLEAQPAYTAFTLRVASCAFEVVTYEAIDYLAAIFTLDIAGQGA